MEDASSRKEKDRNIHREGIKDTDDRSNSRKDHEDNEGESQPPIPAGPPRQQSRNKPNYQSQQLGPTSDVAHQQPTDTRKQSLDDDRLLSRLQNSSDGPDETKIINDPDASDADADADADANEKDGKDDRIANLIERPEFVNQFLDRTPSGSSDDDEPPPSDNNSTTSSNNNNSNPSPNPELRRGLPEFTGAGGGTGIFKVPVRAAVHPARPPALELRPHPLRETQAGAFVRTIACSGGQIWAGLECGLRCWEFSDAYRPGFGASAEADGGGRRGDEDTSPFRESARVSPTICMVVDAGNRLVWTGHRDGKIRSWSMDQKPEGGSFREGFSWHANRGPVLSIAISSYGMGTLSILPDL